MNLWGHPRRQTSDLGLQTSECRPKLRCSSLHMSRLQKYRRRPGGCPAGVLARRAEGETPSGQPARCRRYSYKRFKVVDEKMGPFVTRLQTSHDFKIPTVRRLIPGKRRPLPFRSEV